MRREGPEGSPGWIGRGRPGQGPLALQLGEGPGQGREGRRGEGPEGGSGPERAGYPPPQKRALVNTQPRYSGPDPEPHLALSSSGSWSDQTGPGQQRFYCVHCFVFIKVPRGEQHLPLCILPQKEGTARCQTDFQGGSELRQMVEGTPAPGRGQRQWMLMGRGWAYETGQPTAGDRTGGVRGRANAGPAALMRLRMRRRRGPVGDRPQHGTHFPVTSAPPHSPSPPPTFPQMFPKFPQTRGGGESSKPLAMLFCG